MLRAAGDSAIVWHLITGALTVIRKLTPSIVVVAAGIVATFAGFAADRQSLNAQSKQAPIFEVDPLWPNPLPNHWVTGSTIGLSVDAQDNVWTIHRPNTVEDNFKGAALTPPISGIMTSGITLMPFLATSTTASKMARACISVISG